ncbi:MAG: glycosyltransferase family 4 protein [Chloroherpetonaceae bacterium]|nr:glycosyltransferase family 4 protein [Chloroherpetonaceae bacterium]
MAKHIAIVSLGNVSEDTGGRNYLINFVKTLYKLNLPHRFAVYLSPNQKHLIEPFLSENIRVVEVPPHRTSSVAKVLSEQMFLPFYLSRAVDVAYFPGNFVSLLSPVPSVVAIRSMLYYHYPYTVDKVRLLVRKTLTPPSARKARVIITPSEDIKKDVVKFVGINERKIRVVHHGIDVETFQQNYSDLEREAIFQKFSIKLPFILYASALWEYKNQDKLILAFDKLWREKGLDMQLVIAGKGIDARATYQNRLQELVRAHRLEGRVIFTGQLSHSELKYFYRYCAVFAYPSGYESFGNPLFEAWAAGAPVVCSNVHSFPEMTLGGHCALMVNPYNVDELADALYRVITHPSLRQSLVEAGKKRISSFSWEKCVRETLTILEEAVA